MTTARPRSIAMELPISNVGPAFLYSAVAVALSVFLLLELVLRRCRKLKLPPGPRGLPIIGNLHQMGSLPHRTLQEMSRRYGPLMSLRFGSKRLMVASSAAMAREVLKTHDLSFASRPKTAAGKYTTYGYQDIAWAPYGPYWRLTRRICTAELFSPTRLQSFEPIRREEVRKFLAGLFLSAEQTVSLKKRLRAMTFSNVSRMVIGEVVELEELNENFDEFFVLNGVLNLGDYLPWLEFLDLQGYVRRMKAFTKKMDPFLDKVIAIHNERRNGVKGYVAKDMTDMLLELADNPTAEIKLTMDAVKALVQDMFLGGTDTSSDTIEWGMSELLRHPDVIARAHEELDRVIGSNRWVVEEDLPKLPYMEAIMKETMRLHPAAPLLIPHYSREHCVIDGYDIPAGTEMIVNASAIGRDPAIWEVPLEFRPDRFLGKNIDVKGHDYELIPFGAGRRLCPGLGLGMKVVQTTLSNLLHGFNWKLPNGMQPGDISIEEIFGLTAPRKVPLDAIPVPRLAESLYASP